MKQFSFVIFLMFCFSNLYAAKIGFMVGGFSVDAASDNLDGSLAGVGLYNLSYEYPILGNLDFAIGYTVIMSELIGGDMMFGPDIKLNYYPVTLSNPSSMTTKTMSLSIEEIWRFYGSIGFHQRQVQSVRVAYAGFSVGAGAEYALNHDISLRSEVRYLTMKGASNGEASELSFMVGIVKGFW